jgi:hypothetical protein
VDSADDCGFVVGKNHFDGDIPIGTTFSAITKGRFDSDYKSPWVDLGTVANVRLRLLSVQIFDKDIEVIPRGWGARIRVEGEGVPQLIDALRVAKRGDFVFLIASVQ